MDCKSNSSQTQACGEIIDCVWTIFIGGWFIQLKVGALDLIKNQVNVKQINVELHFLEI